MSVFQAEILAVERCLDINLERNYQKCDIAIHSDSQAAIKALSSYVIDSQMIWESRNKLIEVGKKNKVFLIWVPGHSGIKGNERPINLPKRAHKCHLLAENPSVVYLNVPLRRSFWRRRKPRGKNSGEILDEKLVRVRN